MLHQFEVEHDGIFFTVTGTLHGGDPAEHFYPGESPGLEDLVIDDMEVADQTDLLDALEEDEAISQDLRRRAESLLRSSQDPRAIEEILLRIYKLHFRPTIRSIGFDVEAATRRAIEGSLHVEFESEVE